VKLAFFDFDGTITTKDSLVDFIQFAVGRGAYYRGLLVLSPMLTAYLLKLIPSQRAKERLIAYYFQDWGREEFKKTANRYAIKQIDSIVRPDALEKIRWHQAQGHRVVVVSASIECWLKAWCTKQGIELLSTKLEFFDEKISGRFATKNCYGAEKANRIKAHLNLEEYEHIYAYGDSSGDKELLALADEPHYKPFKASKS